MNALRLYTRYAGVSIRSQMEYRASFIMQGIGQFMVTGFEFMAIWALFERFGSIRGWVFAEIAVFYGMISVAFAVNDALTRGFDIAGDLIKRGEMDRLFLRPRSTALQLFGHELTLRRFGRLTQGVVVLVIGLTGVEVSWHVGKVLLMFWAMAGGCCLFIGLIVVQATISFWTTESLEIMNTLTYGGIETAQYPMTIYLPWFRRFFTFVVPLACVNYFPVLRILEKSDPLGTPVWLGYVSPAAGIVFLLAALGFWRLGMRFYSSTGS